jgi:lipoprotein Spr
MHKQILTLSLLISFLTFFSFNTKSNKVSNLDKVYFFTNEWLHVPYRYGGNSKSGIDCSALTRLFIKDVYDQKIPRTAYKQYKSLKKVSKKDLRRGDLVFFKNNSRRPNHVGIYLGKGKFMHASTKSGVTISNLNQRYYASRFISGGRKI